MGFSGNYLPLSYKEIGPHSITGQGQQSTGELMCLVNKGSSLETTALPLESSRT